MHFCVYVFTYHYGATASFVHILLICITKARIAPLKKKQMKKKLSFASCQ